VADQILGDSLDAVRSDQLSGLGFELWQLQDGDLGRIVHVPTQYTAMRYTGPGGGGPGRTWLKYNGSEIMPRTKIDFDTVRKIVLSLPDVEETTTYGQPSLKVRGKLLACLPSHKSAEPDSLVVRIDFDRREELLAEAPDVYYVTDHYVGYTSVLVRMSRITPDALRDLLNGAWRFMTAKPRSRK